jgi:BirA family transcriptional regulator, biotin operon repressor / biotin---[acetyl-CoA-carboxylase] ligase
MSALGRPRAHFRSTDSTNARARELAAAGAPHGTLVTAAEQTAGRGRQGRAWSAPAGRALLCSLVLRDPPALLPLAAALAVADLAGPRARIKWPNDVLLGERKVAGILIEGRPQESWAVLGIGVNVAIPRELFPPELRETATSLGDDASRVEPALTRLLDALEPWLAGAPSDVLDAYRARDALAGREIAWAAGRGTAEGIDADGSLLVRTPDGRRVALEAGEVHLGSGPA